MKLTLLGGLLLSCYFIVGCANLEKKDATAQVNVNAMKEQSINKKQQKNNEINKRYNEVISLSTPENIDKFNSTSATDTRFIKDSIVSGMKKKLPVLTDEFTMMKDVSYKNDTFTYTFEVKGMPNTIFKAHEIQTLMQNSLKDAYCSDDTGVVLFRALFIDGVVYNYYMKGELIYTYKALPSICP